MLMVFKVLEIISHNDLKLLNEKSFTLGKKKRSFRVGEDVLISQLTEDFLIFNTMKIDVKNINLYEGFLSFYLKDNVEINLSLEKLVW